MTQAVILSVRECSFYYPDGDFRLLGLSLDVRAGEVVGIVGPNGSGKSTLLRLMSGFLVPREGQVLLQGKPLKAWGRRDLARKLAFLPQSPEAPFHFTVREVVAMGRHPYVGVFGFLREADIRVVERAMRDTATEALADRIFATLSGGEKQRVLVASILAQEPSVMLLDEPTAALDIHHQCEVFDLLWSLSRKGIGVCVATHDLNAASMFCDRMVLMSKGRIERVGTPEEVMHQPLLERVYETEVRVISNPVTGTPMVVVLGERAHESV